MLLPWFLRGMNHIRQYGPLIPLLAIALLMAACGIKPGHLEPPPGSTGTFPQTYPAPDNTH